MIWEAATLFLWLLKDRGINSAYFVIIQCSNWGDVSVESIHEPGMIKIYLKRSKNRPTWQRSRCYCRQDWPFVMSSSSCPSIHDDTRFHRRPVHSFRIGAATTAAKAGIEDSTIHMLGRWSSSAFLVYIRTPRELLQQQSPGGQQLHNNRTDYQTPIVQ